MKEKFFLIFAGGGQILREVHSNWDLQSLTYAKILNTVSRSLAGASYSFTRLINVEDKNLKCGLQNFYSVMKTPKYRNLFQMKSIFGFFDKLISPYFIKSPFEFLRPEIIPKVLRVQSSLLGVVIKDELSCLIRPKVPASSDLVRSIDNLVKTISKRLEISDTFLRKVVERNTLSEPVQYVWYF